MNDGGVALNRKTKPEMASIVSATIQRLCLKHGKDRVALEAGCDERTIRDARDGDKNLLSLHFLGNLLLLDESALDEFLAAYGRRSIPLDAAPADDLQLLTDTANFIALHSRAMTFGGWNHVNQPALVEAARPVNAALAARIAGVA